MATSENRPNGDDNQTERMLVKWPLEYLPEAKVMFCCWCSQPLTANFSHRHLQSHFTSCKKRKESEFSLVVQELANINQKIDRLDANMDAMKTEIMAEIKRNQLHVPAKVMNVTRAEKIGEESMLATLLRTPESSEEGIREEKKRDMGVGQEMEMAEELIKTNDLQVLKRGQTEEEASQQLAKKQMTSFHVEPSPFDPLTTPMTCFNLASGNDLFQPTFRWIIDGIENRMTQKAFEMSSRVFICNGYPARAMLHLKETYCVFFSLYMGDALTDECKRRDFTPIPRVFYMLKDRRRNGEHKCRSARYLVRDAFDKPFKFPLPFAHKDWFTHPTYNVGDAVEVEIYSEPATVTRQAFSCDGTLEWSIENFARRLQVEKDDYVNYQESPYFYVSQGGHRAQVEVCLNGYDRSGITSARVLFLMGIYDADLPESFHHSTTVTIINRKEPERSVSKTIVEDIKNKRFYDVEMCTVEEVGNLIENDTLFCKVVIKALL